MPSIKDALAAAFEAAGVAADETEERAQIFWAFYSQSDDYNLAMMRALVGLPAPQRELGREAFAARIFGPA